MPCISTPFRTSPRHIHFRARLSSHANDKQPFQRFISPQTTFTSVSSSPRPQTHQKHRQMCSDSIIKRMNFMEFNLSTDTVPAHTTGCVERREDTICGFWCLKILLKHKSLCGAEEWVQRLKGILVSGMKMFQNCCVWDLFIWIFVFEWLFIMPPPHRICVFAHSTVLASELGFGTLTSCRQQSHSYARILIPLSTFTCSKFPLSFKYVYILQKLDGWEHFGASCIWDSLQPIHFNPPTSVLFKLTHNPKLRTTCAIAAIVLWHKWKILCSCIVCIIFNSLTIILQAYSRVWLKWIWTKTERGEGAMGGGLSGIVRDFNNFPFNMNTRPSMSLEGWKELVNYVQWSSWSLIARC